MFDAIFEMQSALGPTDYVTFLVSEALAKEEMDLHPLSGNQILS